MLQEVRSLLDEVFAGSGPAATAFAPGRVNLIGAHVDYNEGVVQPVPIDRGTYAAVRMTDQDEVRLFSRDEAQRGTYHLDRLPSVKALGWMAYPLGMARTMQQQGHALGGFDLAIAGDLDIGAGLSSSASLLVACGRALDQAFRLGIDPVEMAMLAYRTETNFVGVSCGIMDQMAASVARPGSSLFLDCRDRSFEHIPFDHARLGLVIIDSGTRRTLSTSHFNERVAECQAAVAVLRRHRPEVRALRDATLAEVEAHAAEMPGKSANRARHVVREIARVYEFKEALARGDGVRCGQLISECHRDLRDLYEASTAPLDFLAERANAVDGVLGARLTGAGWGGCVIALTRRGAEPALVESLTREYAARFGRQALCHVVS